MDGRLRLLTLKTLVCSEELGAAGDGGNRRRGQVEVAAVFRLFPATRSFPARTRRGGGRGGHGKTLCSLRFDREGSRRRHRQREEELGFARVREKENGAEREEHEGKEGREGDLILSSQHLGDARWSSGSSSAMARSNRNRGRRPGLFCSQPPVSFLLFSFRSFAFDFSVFIS